MSPNQYQELAAQTAKFYPNNRYMDLIHAALGASGEVGELTDAIKKHVIYEQPLDVANIVEEIGDTLWYLALMLTHLGYDMEFVMEQNIAKLKKRYPEKYSDQAAQARADKQESGREAA